MARPLLFLAVLSVLLAGSASVWAASTGVPAPLPPAAAPQPAYPPVHWHRCRAVGRPWAGRLIRGTRLPVQGQDFFTWDPVRKRVPNRWWRRYACDFTIKKLLGVLAFYRLAFPDAPRVGVGDLSRPRGGTFDERFGGLGHASHQNGLDVDVYYPRLDGLERRSRRVAQVDLELAQELVDLFVEAGAKYVFVGPRTGLVGPRRIVQKLVYHDDHMHVRFRAPRSRR